MDWCKKRMFSLDVVDTDHFLELSVEAQCLYFHLGMRADDDGFLAVNVDFFKRIAIKELVLNELIEAGYIYQLERELIVIREWNINNHIPKRQYVPTKYQRERNVLSLDNGVYSKSIE